ncbi:MAG: hypothetical protein IT367_18095 [Candidatus Hydrogenedentes bacterium]|nr:hypothetical protein [Candidatus Hydrogenedentota bacterium]
MITLINSQYEVQCDKQNCGYVTTIEPLDLDDIYEVHDQLKSEGWLIVHDRTGRSHYCPNCIHHHYPND